MALSFLYLIFTKSISIYRLEITTCNYILLFFFQKDTINDSYNGACNDPPPYSIEPEVHTNNESCETTDHTENEPDKTKNKPTTSAKNILGEKFERFRRTGENNHGFGFQRFQ